MGPVPVLARIGVIVASGINLRPIRRHPIRPGPVLPLIMANDMIAIHWDAVNRAKMTLQTSRRLIHGFGVPRGVAYKSLMLGAEHVAVPTNSVPGVIGFANGLSDIAGRWVAGIAFARPIL